MLASLEPGSKAAENTPKNNEKKKEHYTTEERRQVQSTAELLYAQNPDFDTVKIVAEHAEIKRIVGSRYKPETIRKWVNGKEVSFPEYNEDTFDQKRRYSLSHLENDVLTNGLSEKRTPEDYYLENELIGLMTEFFSEDDLSVLIGLRTRLEVARENGLSYQTYRKRLYRKQKLFVSILEESGYLVN